MSGASIEAALELWASSLRDAKARMRPLFTQERVAASAGRSSMGCSARSGARPGGCGPRRRATLGRGGNKPSSAVAAGRRRRCATSCGQRAGDAGRPGCGAGDRRNRLPQAGQGVLRRRAPVHRLGGKITNCRIGVFAAYASRHGHALIDRALYLPKAWTDDLARLAAAHVPPEVGFATKPRWPPAWSSARSRPRCRSAGWRATASTG